MEESCFVRKDFYIDPPAATATAAEWKDWLKKDTGKARAAKASYTKSFAHTDAGDGLQQSALRKIGGIWKQVLDLGLYGDSEGLTQAEPTYQATQEHELALKNMENQRSRRGTQSKGRNARSRANRKARKG